MTQVAIRQSGGASIISIPKVILRTLALDAGAFFLNYQLKVIR